MLKLLIELIMDIFIVKHEYFSSSVEVLKDYLNP